MIRYQLVIFSWAVAGLQASGSFPPDFKFGAATGAYQVEGAWNESDKSPSIWDELTHRRSDVIFDGSNADVTCDSYHQWERDVDIAHELGLDFYRFSLSWSRICPNGYCNKVNEAGIKYYNQVIDGLLSRGIEPVVTLYHWDLPQKLQNLGGWANPLVSDWFASFSKVAYQHFADRVKTWITINEPMQVCDMSYSRYLAPLIDDPFYGAYLCTKNVLMAHAKAWRVYDKEFKPKYHGQVSLSNYLMWYEPATPADQPLADLVLQHSAGRFSHAIFSKEGGWPPVLEVMIAKKSKAQGYLRSRLPPFTKEERELIRGTYDYYGVNYYTSRMVHSAKPGESVGYFPMQGCVEFDAVFRDNPDWKHTQTKWFKFQQNAQGLRKHLNWLRSQYGDITFLIMENGAPTEGHQLRDHSRVQYLKDHLKEVLLAINEDGLKIKAYTAWSLIDNFEWNFGYLSKFGLYEVNFTDPKRTRTPRDSAHFYADVIKRRSVETPKVEQSSSDNTWIILGAILAVLVAAGLTFKCFKGNKSKSKDTDYNTVPLNDDLALKQSNNRLQD